MAFSAQRFYRKIRPAVPCGPGKPHLSAGKRRKRHSSVGKIMFLQEAPFSAVFSGGLRIMNGSLFLDELPMKWIIRQRMRLRRALRTRFSDSEKGGLCRRFPEGFLEGVLCLQCLASKGKRVFRRGSHKA